MRRGSVTRSLRAVGEQHRDTRRRLAGVVLDPRGERGDADDAGLATELQRHPAAHRVADEHHGPARQHVADPVQGPAGVLQGVLAGAVPAAHPVLQAHHGEPVAGPALDRRGEGRHPQHRAAATRSSASGSPRRRRAARARRRRGGAARGPRSSAPAPPSGASSAAAGPLASVARSWWCRASQVIAVVRLRRARVPLCHGCPSRCPLFPRRQGVRCGRGPGLPPARNASGRGAPRRGQTSARWKFWKLRLAVGPRWPW